MDSMLLIGLAAGAALGALLGILLWNWRLSSVGRSMRALVDRAKTDILAIQAASERETTTMRELQLVTAREEAVAIKEEAAREAGRRREEVERAERRLSDRETQV